MKNIIRFLVVITIFFFAGTISTYASDISLQPTGFVNDFAGVFSQQQKSDLENKLKQFKDQTTNEIAVVVIPDLDGADISSYANELFRRWGIGTKENNNGILLLVSLNDKKMRIEVGYGLEGAIPDITAKKIIDNDIVPSFKQEDYILGINKGVDSIIALTKNEYSDTTNNTDKKQKVFEDINSIFWFIVAILFYTGSFLYGIIAPTKSWWFGGIIGAVIGGAIGYLILEKVFLIIISLCTGLILGFLVDYFISKKYPHRKRGIGGISDYFSNRRNGGSGSSGGFGGFGGGSSGGGGASGGW